MSAKLFVGNRVPETTNAQIRELFSTVQSVASCELIKDSETSRLQGFGFVEMGSIESANTATAQFNGQESNGQVLTVDAAKPRGAR
jgi:RNA recognition motif-containing protein